MSYFCDLVRIFRLLNSRNLRPVLIKRLRLPRSLLSSSWGVLYSTHVQWRRWVSGSLRKIVLIHTSLERRKLARTIQFGWPRWSSSWASCRYWTFRNGGRLDWIDTEQSELDGLDLTSVRFGTFRLVWGRGDRLTCDRILRECRLSSIDIIHLTKGYWLLTSSLFSWFRRLVSAPPDVALFASLGLSQACSAPRSRSLSSITVRFSRLRRPKIYELHIVVLRRQRRRACVLENGSGFMQSWWLTLEIWILGRHEFYRKPYPRI